MRTSPYLLALVLLGAPVAGETVLVCLDAVGQGKFRKKQRLGHRSVCFSLALAPRQLRLTMMCALRHTDWVLSIFDCLSAVDDRLQATDQLPDIDRLAEKSEGATIDCRIARPLILVRRDEDHRRSARLLVQFSLQLDPAETRHLHIDEHAIDFRSWFKGEKFFSRLEQPALVAARLDQVIHGFKDSLVVVDNGYGKD
jgi:hypothetical protein